MLCKTARAGEENDLNGVFLFYLFKRRFMDSIQIKIEKQLLLMRNAQSWIDLMTEGAKRDSARGMWMSDWIGEAAAYHKEFKEAENKLNELLKQKEDE
jgi:hypothetical protein